MAIREWLRIQELGFYRDRIFAFMPRGGKNTVSSAITRALLRRTGQQVHSVCKTRTFAYVCWLLRDFSDHC